MQNLSRHFLITATLAAASTIAGCATTAEQNNPAEGGFWNGVAGVMGGQYDERVEQKEEQLSQEQELNARLEARKRELEKESAQLEQEIGLTRERIVQLDESIALASEQLSDATEENRERKMEFDIARSRLAEFMEVIDSPTSTSSVEITSINKSLDSIETLVETN